MDRSACQRSLARLLAQELAETRALLECLLAEQRTLANPRTADNGATLETVARDKMDRFARIEQGARERMALTQSAGFAPDSDGMQSLLHWCDHDGSLGRDWSQLMDQARLCRDQNLVNGALIEAGRRQVRNVLGLLRGTPSDNTLYDPHGATATGADSRSLAKA